MQSAQESGNLCHYKAYCVIKSRVICTRKFHTTFYATTQTVRASHSITHFALDPRTCAEMNAICAEQSRAIFTIVWRHRMRCICSVACTYQIQQKASPHISRFCSTQHTLPHAPLPLTCRVDFHIKELEARSDRVVFLDIVDKIRAIVPRNSLQSQSFCARAADTNVAPHTAHLSHIGGSTSRL